MNKKWTIHLSLEELEKLEAIVRKGKSSARTIRRAHSLLLAHEGREDKEIAASLKCVESSIYWTRRRYCKEGLEQGDCMISLLTSPAHRELPCFGHLVIDAHRLPFFGRFVYEDRLSRNLSCNRPGKDH